MSKSNETSKPAWATGGVVKRDVGCMARLSGAPHCITAPTTDAGRANAGPSVTINVTVSLPYAVPQAELDTEAMRKRIISGIRLGASGSPRRR